jgi:hypothetical protein
MGADTLASQLGAAADQIEAAVGAERMKALVHEGRALNDADALELACRD